MANLIFNSRKFRRRVFPKKLLPNSTFHFIYITPPESFTSPTSSTSTSSTLHTSPASPTSISTNLTYITQITHIIYINFNQFHLHDIHYLSLSTSSAAQSTGAQHLHIHPASRGVAAHTAGLFRSVRGAKGGFPPWGLPKLRIFTSPPWGLPKLGNFHFSPPWGLPKLGNFHFSPRRGSPS